APPPRGPAPTYSPPAAPAAPLVTHDHYDLVGGRREAQGLPANLLPNFAHLPVEAPNALMTAVRLGVHHPGGHIEFEVAITERDQPVDVAFVQTLVREPHDLHVLLRHRPPSISRRNVAFSLKKALNEEGGGW